MASLRLLAAAKNLSIQKEKDKKKKEEKELAFIKKVISQLPQAPSVDEIASRVVVPTPIQEVVKEVHTKEIEVLKEKPLSKEAIESMIRQQMIEWAEYEKNDNRAITPEIQVIREEMDTEGFVTKKDMDNILKKINNAILANAGGGGLAKAVERDLDKRIDDLVSELTTILKDIATNTEALDSLETLFERTISAIQENRKELELLNARTEEAYETTITKEDLE